MYRARRPIDYPNQLLPIDQTDVVHLNGFQSALCNNQRCNEPGQLTCLNEQLKSCRLSKWTIDDDHYNVNAFGQCEGAWPIAHPLPLPLWSNAKKDPMVIENVNLFDSINNRQ